MEAKAGTDAVQVMLFSGNPHIRQTVMDAAGLSGSFDIPPIDWQEVATPDAVKQNFAENRYAALVLDAETYQEGGQSVARWLNIHADKVPPIIMLVARQQDEWMSRWSGASYTVPAPYEAEAVMAALKQALSAAA